MNENQFFDVFKRGYRVCILSRKLDECADDDGWRTDRWENNYIGHEAIISEMLPTDSVEYAQLMRQGFFEDDRIYKVVLIFPNNKYRKYWWYEHKFLKLICCNEKKGIKILKESGVE